MRTCFRGSNVHSVDNSLVDVNARENRSVENPQPFLLQGVLENLKGAGKPLSRRGHEVAGLGGVGGTAQMLAVMAEAKVKPASLEVLDELNVEAAAFRADLTRALVECGTDATGAHLYDYAARSAAGPATTVKVKLAMLNAVVDRYNSAVLLDLLTYPGLPLAPRQSYDWGGCVAEARAAVANGPDAVRALAGARFEGVGARARE